MNIETAATDAVESCIKDHILEDFLKKEKAGVIRMHILDFDQEKHDKALRTEGFNEGFNDGFRDGQIALIAKMYQKGKTPEDIAVACDIPLNEVRSMLNTGA